LGIDKYLNRKNMDGIKEGDTIYVKKTMQWEDAQQDFIIKMIVKEIELDYGNQVVMTCEAFRNIGLFYITEGIHEFSKEGVDESMEYKEAYTRNQICNFINRSLFYSLNSRTCTIPTHILKKIKVHIEDSITLLEIHSS
jgi:hypothetical protein